MVTWGDSVSPLSLMAAWCCHHFSLTEVIMTNRELFSKGFSMSYPIGYAFGSKVRRILGRVWKRLAG